MNIRENLKNKKRIVIKIGSSLLTHKQTGDLNFLKMEHLVRVLSDLSNQGKDVILVSSGAIAVGRKTLALAEKPKRKEEKQACAAVGQARLMMMYQKLFAEYNHVPAQILMTKNTMINNISRANAHNTFEELLRMKVIPIVNENDTVATEEIEFGEFGENDTLSAIVAALIGADLLILLSDIDGLFTDNPRENKDVSLIPFVEQIDDNILLMAKGAGSDVGTGGMATKIAAARIATDSGADMIIANGEKLSVIRDIINGKEIGTIFKAHKNNNFNLIDYLMAPMG